MTCARRLRLIGTAALAFLAAACSPAADEAPQATGSTAPAAAQRADDALVPGTAYHAVARIPCMFSGQAVAEGCSAGVKRNWDDEGGALVEITKPDGHTRALFTDALAHVTGADSAEADGSAGWTMVIDRRGEISVIDYGPEHYELPDTLVLGE